MVLGGGVMMDDLLAVIAWSVIGVVSIFLAIFFVVEKLGIVNLMGRL